MYRSLKILLCASIVTSSFAFADDLTSLKSMTLRQVQAHPLWSTQHSGFSYQEGKFFKGKPAKLGNPFCQVSTLSVRARAYGEILDDDYRITSLEVDRPYKIVRFELEQSSNQYEDIVIKCFNTSKSADLKYVFGDLLEFR